MKLAVFGLTISSSWGNGHATLWRGLCRALAARGHRIVFFERDVPYYAMNRDLLEMPGLDLRLYADWSAIRPQAIRACNDADVAMITSYCPDGVAATDAVLASRAGVKAFYDLDTPVTLSALDTGRDVAYLGPRGLRDFDLVLSFTGGVALTRLRDQLGARRTATLYGSVDPDVHKPATRQPHYAADLSYLGTYADDRQQQLEQLFVAPARRLPQRRFVLGGAQYPGDFPWQPNVFFVQHLPPGEHSAFFSSSRVTLSVTREAMARMGYCPSGRLFEAAACGTPVLTDAWDGLDTFFTPGEEILVANNSDDAVAAIDLDDARLARIAGRARQRVLDEYTAAHRAAELESHIESARHRDEETLAFGCSTGGEV